MQKLSSLLRSKTNFPWVMDYNKLCSSIMFINHFSNGSDSHVLSHKDYQRIHEQSENAALSSPGNLRLLHSAVFTDSAKDTTMDIGFKLKEVQMPPGSFDCIMHVATWIAAFSTRNLLPDLKSTSISSCFPSGTEIYRLDVPRIFKIQCYLK